MDRSLGNSTPLYQLPYVLVAGLGLIGIFAWITLQVTPPLFAGIEYLAPNTASCLLLLGAASLLGSTHRPWRLQLQRGLAGVAAAISALVLLQYALQLPAPLRLLQPLLNTEPAADVLLPRRMPPHTALALLFAAFGVLYVYRIKRGWGAIVIALLGLLTIFFAALGLFTRYTGYDVFLGAPDVDRMSPYAAAGLALLGLALLRTNYECNLKRVIGSDDARNAALSVGGLVLFAAAYTVLAEMVLLAGNVGDESTDFSNPTFIVLMAFAGFFTGSLAIMRSVVKDDEQRLLRDFAVKAPVVLFRLHRTTLQEPPVITFVGDGIAPLQSPHWHSARGVPTSLLELVHPDDRNGLLKALNRSHATLSALQWEGRFGSAGFTRVCIRANAQRLRGGRGVVWSGIAVDMTEEGNRVDRQSPVAHDHLRDLAMHIEATRENEKAHLARELHDALGATLTAIKMDARWLTRHLPSVPQDLRERAVAIETLIGEASSTVRRVTTQLRPRVLDDLGLAAAMEWQIHEFEKHTGISCDLVLPVTASPFCPAHSIALFRILQECLTNVARHADANRVRIRLLHKNAVAELWVTDNGNGRVLSTYNSTTAHGLRGIRERVLHLGGAVRIRGMVGRGTTVAVTLPVT